MTIAVDRGQEFLASVREIADDVAGQHADDVDRQARFPEEAITALRNAGALSAFVPTDYGGGGVSLDTIAQACLALGRRCSATAMVFAMHQIQVATIVRHLNGDWFEDYLRELSAGQRLIASMGLHSPADVTPGVEALLRTAWERS